VGKDLTQLLVDKLLHLVALVEMVLLVVQVDYPEAHLEFVVAVMDRDGSVVQPKGAAGLQSGNQYTLIQQAQAPPL
jgi:hypothetical protein